MKSIQR